MPDLTGWRRETMSAVGNQAYFTIRPDWVCEVLSPATERYDRGDKPKLYASAGVSHAWLVNPLLRTLEVLRLLRGAPEPLAHAGRLPRGRPGQRAPVRDVHPGSRHPVDGRAALACADEATVAAATAARKAPAVTGCRVRPQRV